MTIWAHALVKNEERYLWFSIKSVIDYVDKILLWDTGSTDKTIDIIKILKKQYPQKIQTHFIKSVNSDEFTDTRQQMLDITRSDWFMILDGDEVWWKDSIKDIVNITTKYRSKYESIVNRYFNIVGDIFHYQPEIAGRYKIDNLTGHLTIRAVKRTIEGLHFDRPHGQQGLFDGNGTLIQDRNKKYRLQCLNPAYLHFTNMIRSTNLLSDHQVIKRSIKYKHEIGLAFPNEFYYPEVFFQKYPEFINNPWISMDKGYKLKSTILTPLRRFKRRFFKSKSGY